VSTIGRALGLLRRALPGGESTRPSGTLDEAYLFRAHESAARAAETALSACQAAGASAAQQRGFLDAAVDALRMLMSRAGEASTGVRQTREALEQIRLVALNTGLEGARLGEPAGKPLTLVADEIRGHVARALASLEEHQATLDRMDGERNKLREQVEVAQQRSADLARELLQAQAAQRDATSALVDVGGRIRDVSTTDPETARAIAEAAEHARSLAAALTTLSSKPHRAKLLRALGPTLGPLLQVLRDEYRPGEDPEDQT
jgi:methyl-accepting chemotaxis protein